MLLLLAQIADVNGGEISYGWMFAKTILAMIIIIALAFLSIKYIMPRFIQMRRRADSNIKVLDFQTLDQRRVVYLLQIKDKEVAVAVSDHAVSKLCEWDIAGNK